MEVHKRPSSSTGFHTERAPAGLTYRRADSFADLDTLYNRTHNLHAPKPLKPRRALTSTGVTADLQAVTARDSTNSPLGGIHVQRMLSIDDEHYMAYEELHEILFSSSSESDLESLSDLNVSSPSPVGVEFTISTPIEMPRPAARADAFLMATPPSRAPNPCSQNHIFRADSSDGLVSPSPPSAVSMSNERRFQHAY